MLLVPIVSINQVGALQTIWLEIQVSIATLKSILLILSTCHKMLVGFLPFTRWLIEDQAAFLIQKFKVGIFNVTPTFNNQKKRFRISMASGFRLGLLKVDLHPKNGGGEESWCETWRKGPSLQVDSKKCSRYSTTLINRLRWVALIGN